MYASYTRKSYTVTFDTNGGSSVNSCLVYHGNKVQEPNNPPEKEGYTFDYWTDEDGFEYDFDTPVTSNLTLYASYTRKSYTVTFDTNGGSSVNSCLVYHGNKVQEPNNPPEKEGYTFDYWTDEDGFEYDFNMSVTSNLTLYASYTRKSYTVTFDTNGGSSVNSCLVYHGNKVQEPNNPPEKEGYTFDYWIDEDGFEYDFDTPVTSDIVIYAKFKINKYNITFMTDNTVISSVDYEYGATVIVPENPSKPSDNTYTYSFSGWDSEITACDGNKVYTATYNQTFIEYTIIFKDYDDAVISSATYHYGETVIVPNNPVREDDETYTYSFDGWDSDVAETCSGNATYTATYTAKERSKVIPAQGFGAGCSGGMTADGFSGNALMTASSITVLFIIFLVKRKRKYQGI